MSHQDKKSLSQIVVNFETLKLVIDWILKPVLFSGMQVRSGSKWEPRLLAATALLWACSDHLCLTDRFAHVRQVAKKIFRWYNDPGDSYQGFIGMLKKWHARLLVAIVAELRLRLREDLADQYLVGGFFCAPLMDRVSKFHGLNRIKRRMQPRRNRNEKKVKQRNRINAALKKRSPLLEEKQRNNQPIRLKRK